MTLSRSLQAHEEDLRQASNCSAGLQRTGGCKGVILTHSGDTVLAGSGGQEQGSRERESASTKTENLGQKFGVDEDSSACYGKMYMHRCSTFVSKPGNL